MITTVTANFIEAKRSTSRALKGLVDSLHLFVVLPMAILLVPLVA
jgi:hypothetical protein